ncbi:hypothetical protein LTR08_008779 [Meristemomyces frigidus]|nr:hypothetical protein LTR08_008779 [Meristemomyces frigidus]
MAILANGASRGASARASRAGSTARAIVKRRDKPYKTEHQRVLTKKKKLDLHTSFATAPPGYTFLPVGTPDLAERCKELSRQKCFSVNVVNAKPVSRNAHLLDKVSYHIHRVGYHFKAEIVEDACKQLRYISHRGLYVKEADLQTQHSESRLAQTLAKYQIPGGKLLGRTQHQRETLDQVRAAIKELFPKIPDQDLHQIVHHAWEEGSGRVGSVIGMELPRRVQLATIARIRHTYTDYDHLLKAFEWREARSIVEPDCLTTLIKWRGETDQDNDDEELEEIVRETIVLDSDDEADGDAHEADDEGSVTEREPGDATDVEITHHTLALDDVGAESAVEGLPRHVLDRFRTRHRDLGQRNAIAKQKIGVARQRLRAAASPPAHPIPIGRPASRLFDAHSNASHVNIQLDQYGRIPQELVLGGERYLPAPPQQTAGPNNYADEYRPVYAQRRAPSYDYRPVRVVIPEDVEMIDLTSPARPRYERPPVGAHDQPPGHALHSRPQYALPPQQLVPVAEQGYYRGPVPPYQGDACTLPVVKYLRPPQPLPQPPLQPVHGAPAPVQQVPRQYTEPLRQQYTPADGAVAPTQYYHPR